MARITCLCRSRRKFGRIRLCSSLSGKTWAKGHVLLVLTYADCPADGAGGRASPWRSLDHRAEREAVCLSVFQLLPPGPEALPFSPLHPGSLWCGVQYVYKRSREILWRGSGCLSCPVDVCGSGGHRRGARLPLPAALLVPAPSFGPAPRSWHDLAPGQEISPSQLWGNGCVKRWDSLKDQPTHHSDGRFTPGSQGTITKRNE